MTTVQFSLPDSVAREAEKAGLLTDEAMEAVLRKELRRRSADDLFSAMDKMADMLDTPMTMDEIQAEINAVRRPQP